jgi:hypothetical protein
MNSTVASIIGFTLLIIGFLSLMLMGFGLRLTYLSFIDDLGNLLGFLVRLAMIIVGLIILYVARTSTRPS